MSSIGEIDEMFSKHKSVCLFEGGRDMQNRFYAT